MNFYYRCTECARTFRRDEVRYLCPDCGKLFQFGLPLRGVLEVVFDYDGIRKQFKKNQPDWMLFSAVEKKYFPPFPVGNTPFIRSERLEAALHTKNIWVKYDALNPSGSLKDRASFLVVAEAIRLGEDRIVVASTGNAASALAAVCASAKKQAIIFVPEKAPKAKLVQMFQYGAKVVPLKGVYDDAFRLSIEYTNLKGGLNRNSAYHPLTIEGKKTVGFEIIQQNQFKVPDVIFIPVGDGAILAGVYKAFYDLKQARVIHKIPRLVGVQAASSDAIHHFVKTGKYRNAKHPSTVADSISVMTPSNAFMAHSAILASKGFTLAVTDEAILKAQLLLSRTTGLFAEPSAAAALAGLQKAIRCELVEDREQKVLLITGHGLKDIDAAMKKIQSSEKRA